MSRVFGVNEAVNVPLHATVAVTVFSAVVDVLGKKNLTTTDVFGVKFWPDTVTAGTTTDPPDVVIEAADEEVGHGFELGVGIGLGDGEGFGVDVGFEVGDDVGLGDEPELGRDDGLEPGLGDEPGDVLGDEVGLPPGSGDTAATPATTRKVVSARHWPSQQMRRM